MQLKLIDSCPSILNFILTNGNNMIKSFEPLAERSVVDLSETTEVIESAYMSLENEINILYDKD